MKKQPVLRKNQQIFHISTQKSSYQFDKTAQFYQPQQNNIINKRYNEYERKPKSKNQIDDQISHPSTSDTQKLKGTAFSSLQTSEQNSPLGQVENQSQKIPINQKYINIQSIPFKEASINQLQLIRVQKKLMNSIVLRPQNLVNYVENQTISNMTNLGQSGKIPYLMKEPPEVSFGEDGATQFNTETQLQRKSGRKFHVRPCDLEKIVKEQEIVITRALKTTQQSPPQSATVQTIQRGNNTDYLQKNIYSHINTGSRSHSPKFAESLQRASPLPDIFMTAAKLKRHIPVQEKGIPSEKAFNQDNNRASKNNIIQQKVQGDFNNTLSQMDQYLSNMRLFNDEFMPTKHNRIQSVTDTKQPLIRLPIIESQQSIRSKSFLQRKAQIKIINRIFSGKSQS